MPVSRVDYPAGPPNASPLRNPNPDIARHSLSAATNVEGNYETRKMPEKKIGARGPVSRI